MISIDLMEQYGLAQMYMVTKMQRENTGDGEGVEVLINKPFKNDELGDGQYTFKVYHLERHKSFHSIRKCLLFVYSLWCINANYFNDFTRSHRKFSRDINIPFFLSLYVDPFAYLLLFVVNCSKFPSWITALAPPNCLKIEEESWNAYPKCKAGITIVAFSFIFSNA